MWKDLMAELENLSESNGRNAHRVATICRQLLGDPKWLDGEWKGNRDEAESALSKFSNRMALSLDSLLVMLDFFPNVEDWDGADLEALRWRSATMLNERQRQRRSQQSIGSGMVSNGRHPGRPVAADKEPDERKVVSELASEYDHKLKERAATEQELRALIAKKDKEIARLHAKVAELQITIARLRNRKAKMKSRR